MKPPAVTDQWVDTDPDSVYETHLGAGQAIINEEIESFTEGWLRIDVTYHSQTEDFWGAPVILSGWDEATAYYAILFFEDPLLVLPKYVTMFLSVEKIRGLPPTDKQSALEFTGMVLPTPPFLSLTYSHGTVETDHHPTVMKLAKGAKGALVTMFQS